MTRPVSAVRLRRLALRSQGLAGTRAFGTGRSGVERTLARIGYVQIDTISVVARAHHHVLFNRVARYDEDMLNAVVRRRRAFEYWGHAAAYLPMEHFRFALPMMRSVAGSETGWGRGRDPKLRARVLDRIREEGPLFARDFEDPRASRKGWWDWKPAKRALEQLFMEGQLTSVERQGFQKRYELMERFLPADVDTREPTDEEYADHLIDLTLRAHGFATVKTMGHMCRVARLRQAMAARVAERVRAGELEARPAPDGAPIHTLPGALDRSVAPLPPRVRLLSPFDPTVIQRTRCAHVFGFDYTIECYVPEAKRKYGYYVLPVLMGDRFVARMDAKAHRAERRFEIRALYLEDDAPPDGFFDAFAAEVSDYARFTGCDEVTAATVTPERWRPPLEAAIGRLTDGVA